MNIKIDPNTGKQMKAIALFSGGLDSTLAIKLIVDQGIEVIACNINTGFGGTKDRRDHMKNMCDQVGAKLRIIDIQSEYIQETLFDPANGYGKHFNPCIDCHAKMFEVARRIMKDEGAAFLISGEVLGQRPMSQNGDALAKVLNIANVEGLLLRPMCAKLLEPTIAETEGWVDRELLEGVSGRSRDRQFELAKKYKLTDFESPGGGCLLTDENFAKKMRDFIKYDTFEVSDIPVIKYGRHLRLPDGAKLVIGRNEEDNEHIKNVKSEKYIRISPKGVPGPISLLSKSASESDSALAKQLVLVYSKTVANENYELNFGDETVSSLPFESKAAASQYFIL